MKFLTFDVTKIIELTDKSSKLLILGHGLQLSPYTRVEWVMQWLNVK